MAAIFPFIAEIVTNEVAEPAPLRRVQTVVQWRRCVGDFAQIVGARAQGVGLHAHIVDGCPILIVGDLVVLGFAFLGIGALRFPHRSRSLLPQLEHPIGTALRHVVQCSLNGAPILALIRRQPKNRLETSDSRVGNVHNLIGGSSAHLVSIASIVRDGAGRKDYYGANRHYCARNEGSSHGQVFLPRPRSDLIHDYIPQLVRTFQFV
jgi:hypothetical protein